MRDKSKVKEQMISIKLSAEEIVKLKKMRDDFDINISSYLRKCLSKRYEELYPEENASH